MGIKERYPERNDKIRTDLRTMSYKEVAEKYNLTTEGVRYITLPIAKKRQRYIRSRKALVLRLKDPIEYQKRRDYQKPYEEDIKFVAKDTRVRKERAKFEVWLRSLYPQKHPDEELSMWMAWSKRAGLQV